MTRTSLKDLLSMIVTEDTDPDVFEFVLKRVWAEITLVKFEEEIDDQVER